MALWNIVPTWFEIEDRMTHDMGHQGGHGRIHINDYASSISLNIRRIHNIRTAFTRAEWEVAGP